MSTERIKEFTENATPDNWLKYAEELKQSAIFLWQAQGKTLDFNSETQEYKERPSISRTFMLVCGLSLENLLKAYLIALDPKLINQGQLANKLKEHNLITLSILCIDIIFNEQEIDLMEILSDAIPYWGRYPIPLSYNQLKAEKIASKNILETFKTLYNKLFYKTYDKIKSGWDAENGVRFLNLTYKNFEEE